MYSYSNNWPTLGSLRAVLDNIQHHTVSLQQLRFLLKMSINWYLITVMHEMILTEFQMIGLAKQKIQTSKLTKREITFTTGG